MLNIPTYYLYTENSEIIEDEVAKQFARLEQRLKLLLLPVQRVFEDLELWQLCSDLSWALKGYSASQQLMY